MAFPGGLEHSQAHRGPVHQKEVPMRSVAVRFELWHGRLNQNRLGTSFDLQLTGRCHICPRVLHNLRKGDELFTSQLLPNPECCSNVDGHRNVYLECAGPNLCIGIFERGDSAFTFKQEVSPSVGRPACLRLIRCLGSSIDAVNETELISTGVLRSHVERYLFQGKIGGVAFVTLLT